MIWIHHSKIKNNLSQPTLCSLMDMIFNANYWIKLSFCLIIPYQILILYISLMYWNLYDDKKFLYIKSWPINKFEKVVSLPIIIQNSTAV